MKKALNFITVIFLFLSINTFVKAQEVVVSEYRNVSGNPVGEWTELLVISDNIDLTGYILRDNAGSGGLVRWQGGVKFTNDALWKGLREGTIIVINHRGAARRDDNRGDGFIEVGAEDSKYFEKVMYDGDLTNWDASALNLNKTAEIVQLLNASESHVHCLAHMSDPTGTDFEGLPTHKIAHNGPVANGRSIFVSPGRQLSDYNVGFDNGNNFTGTGADTKGRPNSVGAVNNSAFWRELRQPEWKNPNLTVTLNADDVGLRWNSAPDAVNDGTLGYLVIRINKDDIAGLNHPRDGKSYSQGDNIGNAVVVYNGRNNLFTDKFRIPCGETFIYRVYAFRYSNDDLKDDGNPDNGKGRSYNETDGQYAEKEVYKPDIPDLTLQEKDGKTVFCDDEEFELILDFEGNPDDYEYQWKRDGVLVADWPEGRNSLKDKRGGKYEVTIRNQYGCKKTRNIDITVAGYPEPRILRDDYSVITKDTTFILCEGDEITLRTDGGDTRQWLKDDIDVPGADRQSLLIDAEGVYYVKAWNAGNCEGETFKVTVIYFEFDLTPDRTSINFTLTVNETEKDENLILTNNTDRDIIFNSGDITITSDFEILEPPPYIVPANGSLELTVHFTRAFAGTKNGTLKFSSLCDNSLTIDLSGFKPGSSIQAENFTYDIGLLYSCDTIPVDTTVVVENTGTEAVDILLPEINPPFTISNTSDFPQNLPGESNLDVVVEFDPSADGIYLDTLRIPYDNGANIDTLKVVVKGEFRTPSFTTDNDNFDLTIPDCETYVDTVIKINNTGGIDIVFDTQIASSPLSILNLPLTVLSGEQKDLMVRFEPRDQNDLETPLSADIISKPCDLIKSIDFTGHKNGLIFNISESNISFDTLITCNQTPQEAVRSFDINISGTSVAQPEIKSINITGSIGPYINLDINTGQILPLGNSNVNVTFTGAPDGYYTGTIEITFDPCEVAQVINLEGWRFTPSYSLDKAELQFGNVAIGSSSTDSFIITNSGEVDLVVNNLDVTLPFSVDFNQTKALPFTIKPGLSETVYIVFQPQNSGDFEEILYSPGAEPCDDGLSINIKGKGISSSGGTILGQIPVLSGRPGEIVDIPIDLSPHIDPFDFSSGDIESIEIDLSFNEYVFYPQTLKPGTIPSSAIESMNLSIPGPGQANIKIKISDPSKVKQGNIIYLSGQALLGDELFTNIDFNGLIINSGTNIETGPLYSGKINIVGDCSIENKAVGIEPGYLILNCKNPADRDIELSFKIAADGHNEIYVVDAYGNVVFRFDDIKDLKAGEYNKILPVSGLSNGSYIIILRNWNFTKAVRFILLK